jgi:hypothetical protein
MISWSRRPHFVTIVIRFEDEQLAARWGWLPILCLVS